MKLVSLRHDMQPASRFVIYIYVVAVTESRDVRIVKYGVHDSSWVSIPVRKLIFLVRCQSTACIQSLSCGHWATRNSSKCFYKCACYNYQRIQSTDITITVTSAVYVQKNDVSTPVCWRHVICPYSFTQCHGACWSWFLADRTVLRLSSVTWCIVVKRCVLEQKLLLIDSLLKAVYE